MNTALFGIDSQLCLPDDAKYATYGAPAVQPLEDVVAAVRAALTDPLEYPPLAATLVEGDRVAIVLGLDLVKTDQLVAGVVLELLEAGVQPEEIVIVRADTDGEHAPERPTGQLPVEIRDRIRVVIHDPEERENIAMLNISKDLTPIYLNREIVEADVVLPIGIVRPTDSFGDLGIHGNLFSIFSDTETRERFNSPDTLEGSQRRKRLEEAEEAMWYLGTRLVIQVVPGAGEELLNVIAGDTEIARTTSQRLCDAAWRFEVEQPAQLVVATVPGMRTRQSWANLARALNAALRVVDHDGTIAVCCELVDRPGKSLTRLVDAHSLDLVQAKVQKDKTPDAISASQLIRAMQNTNVFLLSKLDEDLVHSLGLSYIAEPEEVARLASRFESCTLLENAHQSMPSIPAEVMN